MIKNKPNKLIKLNKLSRLSRLNKLNPKLNPGFKQFLVKTGLFVGLFGRNNYLTLDIV